MEKITGRPAFECITMRIIMRRLCWIWTGIILRRYVMRRLNKSCLETKNQHNADFLWTQWESNPRDLRDSVDICISTQQGDVLPLNYGPLAGAGGIEPTLTVLETVVLPLYDAPMSLFVR